jgi:hypothetical protein
MRKIAIAVAVATTVMTGVLGVPISAHAGAPAALWASAHGSGTTCSKAEPCALTQGSSSLKSGGTLVLEPGSYGSAAAPLMTTIGAPGDTTVEGEPGKAPPVIYSAADNYGLLLGSVRHVHVVYSGTGNGLVAATSMDHVSVISQDGSNRSSACGSLAASVTDSLCINESNQGFALTVVASIKSLTIRGVTAIDNVGEGTGISAYESQPNTTGDVAVINSIAIGIVDDGGLRAGPPPLGGTDQNIDVTVSHSDVSQAVSDDAPDGDGEVIIGKGLIETVAQFVNPPLDDYRELATSPTVNTGASDPSNDIDLAGLPRTLGSAPDMGAYEYAEKPTVTHAVAKPASRSSIKVTATVDPQGLPASVIAVATRGRVSTRSKALKVSGDKGKREVFVIKGLKAHAAYRVDLVATNKGGQTTSHTVKTKA